jgi:hypothetical protein
MKIRSKVTVGIVFLFLEFLIIGILCLYYFRSMNHNTDLVITDNYNTLQYTENMNQAIDELQNSQTLLFFNRLYHMDNNSMVSLLKKFETNLEKEEHNITEYGEKELVESLNLKYKKYKSYFLKQTIDSVRGKVDFYFVNVLTVYNEIKTTISSISNLNMQAIIQKNKNLDLMVNNAYKNLSMVLTIFLLISITFIYNFPAFITKPIKEITEKIQLISENNFEGQISNSKSGDFKDLINIFNNLTEKLKEKYQPIVIEKEIFKSEKVIHDKLLLDKTKTLLGSIAELLNIMSQKEQNESLKNQSEKIKSIEDDLNDIIKQ